MQAKKARGGYEEFSDIDVLIILNEDVDNKLRENIFSISFEIELKYDVIFGILVESKAYWNSSKANAMPIHWNIDKEGLSITGY